MNTAYQLPPQPLLEAFDDTSYDSLDEVSGIHRRYTFACAFECNNDAEPSPVYTVLDGSDARYYVGVRFPTGIIVADGWANPMWRDGVPLELIDAVSTWLETHVL